MDNHNDAVHRRGLSGHRSKVLSGELLPGAWPGAGAKRA